MFLPYRYSADCVGSIWTRGPEPLRLIGPSLLLNFLVMRHQVPCGCPHCCEHFCLGNRSLRVMFLTSCM